MVESHPRQITIVTNLSRLFMPRHRIFLLPLGHLSWLSNDVEYRLLLLLQLVPSCMHFYLRFFLFLLLQGFELPYFVSSENKQQQRNCTSDDCKK